MRSMNAPPLPGSKSWTNVVPPAVPSVFHNSNPFTPSSAAKKSVLPTAAPSSSLDPIGPG